MPLSKFRTVTATVRFSARPPAAPRRDTPSVTGSNASYVASLLNASRVCTMKCCVSPATATASPSRVINAPDESNAMVSSAAARAGFRRAKNGLPRTCAPPSVTLNTYGSGTPSES